MGMPEVPPFDQGNSLLAVTQAQLSLALMDTPDGQRMALTIRTPSTTLTVLLDGTDAKAWSDTISQQAAAMSRRGLVVANGHVQISGTAT